MLVEIYCSEFKSNGVERPAIQFHTGLNIILGDDNRSNSVGKSTFLMILDFVFGGNDYINKCQDVHKNVPAHTICFTFQFDNQLYYFSRSTKDYRHVVKCDSKYKPIREKKPLSLDAYGGFLADKYGIMIQGLTWRGAVGPFIRVYKRETMDVERPIQHAKREKPEKAIQAYMQLYDKYQAVQEQIFRAQKAEEDFKVFDQSQKRQFVRTAKNEKEFQRNEATARKLEAREKELSVNSDRGLLDVDSVKAHQLLQLNELLSGYRKQRTQVKAQLDAVRAEISEGRNDFKRKYSDLERFFPGIEFRAIEEVECFHRSLSEILIDEYHETERALSATYSMLSNEIEQIEIQIEEVENISNVSQAVLHEYAEIITELNLVREANKNFKQWEKLKSESAEATQTRDAFITDQLRSIETPVNFKMWEINSRIVGDEAQIPPTIKLERLKKYTFSTVNDGGSGAQSRGLIVFDLANLELSPLPFIVHDSDILDPIEKSTLTFIVKEYDSQKRTGLQVFAAFRSYEFFEEAVRDIISHNTVLELSAGGNELFGWAWNKKKTGEESGDMTVFSNMEEGDTIDE